MGRNMKFRSVTTNKYSMLLTMLALIAVISSCSSKSSEPKTSLPTHTIKYQTDSTMHLEVKDQNLSKEQCIAIIETYRDKANHQVAVYKYSSLSEAPAPWCVINLQDPENHSIFFNDQLFPRQSWKSFISFFSPIHQTTNVISRVRSVYKQPC